MMGGSPQLILCMDTLGLVLAAQDLNLVWGNIGVTGATSYWSLRSPSSQNLSM